MAFRGGSSVVSRDESVFDENGLDFEEEEDQENEQQKQVKGEQEKNTG